jgi:hypothetical protein
VSNQQDKITAQEKLIEKLADFSTFVIKCVRQSGEYSPVSSQEPREIESAIKDYYKESNCHICHKGTMKELSIYDDMDGMLTCDKCGVRAVQ